MDNYKLEPYLGPFSQHECPRCNNESLSLYVDYHSGKPISKYVGRCSNAKKCGYDKNPTDYFEHGLSEKQFCIEPTIEAKPVAPIRYNYIEKTFMEESEAYFEQNNLFIYLMSIYSEKQVNETFKSYHVGTSTSWKGATMFWYLDKNEKIRSGKTIKFHKSTGVELKRDGVPVVESMHDVLFKQGIFDENYKVKNGLFGEHLLIDNEKPVAIVENEMTAIIASLEFPKYIWLAIGDKNGLNKSVVQILKDRDVILYPNNDSYHLWFQKAGEFNMKISSLIRTKNHLKNYDRADLSDWIYYKREQEQYCEQELSDYYHSQENN